MKAYRNWDYSFLIVLMLFCLTNFAQAEYGSQKHRRGKGGYTGLIPFARVGRSDPNLGNEFREEADIENNAYPPAYIEEYEDVIKNGNKRNQQAKTRRIGRFSYSMFNQPRIGRIDPQLGALNRLMALQRALEKPSASGMWFGPRLGKRSMDSSEATTVGYPSKDQPEEY